METAHLPNGKVLQGGKYKIVRFIGSGGFGCTYEGEHTMLGSKVAIKEFFVRDFCGRDETTAHVTVWMPEKRGLFDKLKKKFLEEAKAIWQMRHNNIVRVTDLFEENDTAYYVMDYIEGQSLEKMIKDKGPLSEQTALKYIRQVADALAYVHSLNRLHLDLKPANIMTDGHGKAILVDFGVSKQYDEVDGENTSTLMGKTPGYAPIEQMGNSVSTFTPSTDIYALGATLYKLLTGNTPIEATRLASGESLAPLPRNVSKNVAKAIQSAMQIDKTDRPQSIDKFISLLDTQKRPKGGKTSDDDKTIITTPPGAVPLHTEGRSNLINGHEYVDLGLSVKWATCNVGASSPSDYGYYFAWGDVKTKSKYTAYNSRYYGDEKYILQGIFDDAARANWGDSWRIPRANEIDELVTKCDREWTTQNNHWGYRITGPNGNSIFLPAAGFYKRSSLQRDGNSGFYWSATPYEDPKGYEYDAYGLCFMSDIFTRAWNYRCYGFCVRPVSGKVDSKAKPLVTPSERPASVKLSGRTHPPIKDEIKCIILIVLDVVYVPLFFLFSNSFMQKIESPSSLLNSLIGAFLLFTYIGLNVWVLLVAGIKLLGSGEYNSPYKGFVIWGIVLAVICIVIFMCFSGPDYNVFPWF